jgi:hypothetical protein
MAETDPLPFVPARWIAGVRIGSSFDMMRRILSNPRSMPGVGGAGRKWAGDGIIPEGAATYGVELEGGPCGVTGLGGG